MTKKTSTAVQAALEAASSATSTPTEDSLKRVRAKLAEARDLDITITELTESLTAAQKKLTRLRTEELPALFQEVRINSLGLEPEGNLPGYDTKLVPHYSAKLPEDERAEQAYKKFKWLVELRKNNFIVKFDKGDDKKAKALVTFLKKSKITSYENKMGVLSQTLTAEIRRRCEDGQPFPPADLDLLGAYVGQVVKITRRKD